MITKEMLDSLTEAGKKLSESDYFKLLFANRFTNEHNIKHIEDLEKGSLKNITIYLK